MLAIGALALARLAAVYRPSAARRA